MNPNDAPAGHPFYRFLLDRQLAATGRRYLCPVLVDNALPGTARAVLMLDVHVGDNPPAANEAAA